MALYSSVADWRAYAAARGNQAPADASEADAGAALQRASDYIRTRYVLPLRLSGDAENVIEATNIAASLELANPGFWSTTFTPAQAKVLVGVGDVRWQVTGSMAKGFNAQVPVSPAIDALFGGTSHTGLMLGVIG